MFLVIFSVIVCASIYAAPVTEEIPVAEESMVPEVVASQYVHSSYVAQDHSKTEVRDGRGQYGLTFLASNGIEVSERGYLKPGENGTFVYVKEGSFKYPDLNGTSLGYKYIADERGYVVENL